MEKQIVIPSTTLPRQPWAGGIQLYRLIRSFVVKPSEFHRYLMASGFAFTVDFGSLALLTQVFNVPYLISAAIAFLLGLASIYILSSRWVFSHRRLDNRQAEMLLFSLIGLVGLGINELGLYFMSGVLGIFYLHAKVLTTLLVFSWNYGARKLMLFS